MEAVTDGTANQPERNFDLNAEVKDNNEDTKAAAAAALPASSAIGPVPAGQSSSTAPETTTHEEYPGWSLSEVDKMAIDPLQLAQMSTRMDEEEEDYDEEG
ncbi:unnamed protein product [Linum tenue]|uniref:Uncharacterized protein n=1 Tax=Linum tenue TaxID=586396 RepID=A0AAV0KHT9_9ROSI|nr:unnamed protein product [Linum tenue]